MYNFNSINNNTISKDYILSKISSYEIFRYYIGNSFIVNKAFNSPLRKDDIPSFGIFKQDNEYLYKDFATGESGGCFKFVKDLLNYRSYKQTIERIYLDLVLNSKLQVLKKQYKKEYKSVDRHTEIGIRRGRFTKTDLNYWSKYNITETILKKFNTFKALDVFINNKPKWYYTDNSPIYAYKVFNNFKIYRPKAPKDQKWRGNLTIFEIGGYEQLPETVDALIITKSIKDVMCLYSYGYSAICPPAETTMIPDTVINKLKQRFKYIYIFYDNDEPGINAASKMSDKYKLKSFIIPQNSLKKDISDYTEYYGTTEAKKLLKQLINGLKT